MGTQTNAWVYVCGNGNAWPRQLGCACKRCTTINYNMAPPPGKFEEFRGWDDPPIRAHTSAAIILPDTQFPEMIGNYFLIDCGAGVVQSLMCSGLRGLGNLTALFLTHWHPDHSAGLNELCETIKRAKTDTGKPFVKFPVYATLETYKKLREEKGLKYEFDAFMRFQEIVPDTPVVIQDYRLASVTAVEVAHGYKESIKGAVVYIFTVAEKKIVCFWDIDIPGALRPSDSQTNRNAMEARKEWFFDADVMIMEANTYGNPSTQEKPTGHTTFEMALAYLNILQPKARKEGKVFITHMSGHEDGEGNPGYGWNDVEWERQIWWKHNIHIARQGMLVRV